MNLLITQIIIISLTTQFKCTQSRNRSETTRILAALNNAHEYNVEEADSWKNDQPTEVDLSIYVEGMGGLDISKMTFSLDTYLKMSWYDSRLNHSNPDGIELTMDGINKVWRPDVYFVNARSASFQNVIKPNKYVHIRPNDASSTRWIKLMWRKMNPVEISTEIELPELDIVDVFPEADEVTYNALTDDRLEIRKRHFSRLTMKMKLLRRPSHYISLLYVPNAIIVIISWLSFWIDSHATPARVTLCFTSFLTLTTAVAATSKLLPPVSYTTALGIWTEVCVVFVFGTLLEFAVVHIYSKRASHLKAKVVSICGERELLIGIEKDSENHLLLMASVYENKCKRIDQASRILFPLFFVIFIVVYGIVYGRH